MNKLLSKTGIIGSIIEDVIILENYMGNIDEGTDFCTVIVTNNGVAILDNEGEFLDNEQCDKEYEFDADALHSINLLDDEEYNDSIIWEELELFEYEPDELEKIFNLLKKRGYGKE